MSVSGAAFLVENAIADATCRVPSESDGIQSPDREYSDGFERAEGLLGKVITCRVSLCFVV